MNGIGAYTKSWVIKIIIINVVVFFIEIFIMMTNPANQAAMLRLAPVGALRRAAIEIGRRHRLTRLRQERQDARRARPDRDKAVRHPGRQRDRVVGADQTPLVGDPHLEHPVEHDDDLVDGVVKMGRRAGAGLDDAEARRAGDAFVPARKGEAAIARPPRDFNGIGVVGDRHCVGSGRVSVAREDIPLS